MVALWPLWYKSNAVSPRLRIGLYGALVRSKLKFNMHISCPTQTEIKRLEVVHRKHLRRMSGMIYPVITNGRLYKISRQLPLLRIVLRQRWNLFGNASKAQSTISPCKQFSSIGSKSERSIHQRFEPQYHWDWIRNCQRLDLLRQMRKIWTDSSRR